MTFRVSLLAILAMITAAVVTLAPFQAAPAMAQTTASEDGVYQYQLGSGDKVRLIVFGEKDLSGEFVVNGAGIISLPLIGDVQARGLTASELQTRIATAYAQGYLIDPKVNIEVMNFRPFYILGEVNKPGEYPYSDGLTVVNAVARAEGYTYRADTRRVYIKHANQEKEVAVPLTSTVMVAPGDTIRIGERFF
ncbi:polysaccharide biosynthesis/export family protein [Asticcacaulis tiandongensis]|uniref:polysaccharide biosynthesis/export family protein n=1 Tax=Asticcacaulis tiandongensis TaxID=2565365 RepID=UPI00112E43A6|nr:polysaccharide biosynthesis/export family protein [Asticcacaulis tiandongensis]